MAKWPSDEDKDKNKGKWPSDIEKEKKKSTFSRRAPLCGYNAKDPFDDRQFHFSLSAPPEPLKKQAEDPRKPPPQIRVPNYIVNIKVVDDATNAPIANVEFDVSLFNSSNTATIKTDSRGIAIGEGVKKECRVACSYFRHEANEFYEFVGEGEERIGPAPEQTGKSESSEPPPSRAIIGSLIRHQVADGETLVRLAVKYDLNCGTIAGFNWGVRFSEDIDQYLEENFGCNMRDANGQYVLKGSMAPNPWIIFIPSITWFKKIECTEKGPTSPIIIRVRNHLKAKLNECIELDLYDDDGNLLSDTQFAMVSDQGSNIEVITDQNGFARIDDMPANKQWHIE